MTKNPRVVERNPKLSTKMPDRVGPRKLPRKNEDVHIPKTFQFDDILIC